MKKRGNKPKQVVTTSLKQRFAEADFGFRTHQDGVTVCMQHGDNTLDLAHVFDVYDTDVSCAIVIERDFGATPPAMIACMNEGYLLQYISRPNVAPTDACDSVDVLRRLRNPGQQLINHAESTMKREWFDIPAREQVDDLTSIEASFWLGLVNGAHSEVSANELEVKACPFDCHLNAQAGYMAGTYIARKYPKMFAALRPDVVLHPLAFNAIAGRSEDDPVKHAIVRNPVIAQMVLRAGPQLPFFRSNSTFIKSVDQLMPFLKSFDSMCEAYSILLGTTPAQVKRFFAEDEGLRHDL